MKEDDEPEWDFNDDPDNEDDDTYYICYCCNYSCVERPAWGGQCPKCGAIMNEESL